MAVPLNPAALLAHMQTLNGHQVVTQQLTAASAPWPAPVGADAWTRCSRRMGCRKFTQQPAASGYPQPRIAYPGQPAGQSARYYVQRVWAAVNAGRVLDADEEGSHLCGNKLCVVQNHVLAESGPYNKSRDTCKYFLFEKLPHEDPAASYLCVHQPPCLYAVDLALQAAAAAGNPVAIPNHHHVY